MSGKTFPKEMAEKKQEMDRNFSDMMKDVNVMAKAANLGHRVANRKLVRSPRYGTWVFEVGIFSRAMKSFCVCQQTQF